MSMFTIYWLIRDNGECEVRDVCEQVDHGEHYSDLVGMSSGCGGPSTWIESDPSHRVDYMEGSFAWSVEKDFLRTHQYMTPPKRSQTPDLIVYDADGFDT
jgi:hypothetical protein